MLAQVRWCLFQEGSKKAGRAKVRIGPLAWVLATVACPHRRDILAMVRPLLFRMAGLAKGGCCYEHTIRA